MPDFRENCSDITTEIAEINGNKIRETVKEFREGTSDDRRIFNVAAKILKRRGGPSAAVGSGDCFKASKQDSSCNSSRVLINHRFKASNCTSWSRSMKILSKVLISPLFTIFNRSRSEKNSSRVLDPVHGANPWKARSQCSVISQASLIVRICVGRSPAIHVQNSASVSRWQFAGRRRHAGTTEMSAATKLHLTSTRSKSISFQVVSFSLFETKAKPRIAPRRTKHASLSLNKGAVAQMERTVKDMMESAKAIDELRLLGRSKSISLVRSLGCGKYLSTLVFGGIIFLSQKSVTDEINQFNVKTKKKVEPLRIDVPVANLNYSYRSAISAEEVACDSESVSSGNC
nr:QWRF motif-containing protein 2-like [Ipomoea batatas]